MALAVSDLSQSLCAAKMRSACFSCGGSFDDTPDGPVHAYMHSSPGCWVSYGQLLEHEYSEPALFASCHRLTVDAYALQHPGSPGDLRAVQPVWLPATSLWLIFRDEADHEFATNALKALTGRTPTRLPVAPPRFSMTHADIVERPLLEHSRCVAEWARAALREWSELHGEIARLAKFIRG